ncbi:MAG: cold shock domain-containing protein [Chloroflexia bacterium]|nr:cold shock domain-containing protein [Chloroflexia bacterium]
MPTGTVKWYDPDKGFGFVAREDGENDRFLQHTVAGLENLAAGDRITFAVGYGLKGERAEDIRVVERSGKPARVRVPREFGDSGYGTVRRAGAPRERYGREPTQDLTALPRLEGTVRRFDTERGFGFICSAGLAEDVFFHSSVVTGEVRRATRQSSALGWGRKGCARLTCG